MIYSKEQADVFSVDCWDAFRGINEVVVQFEVRLPLDLPTKMQLFARAPFFYLVASCTCFCCVKRLQTTI